MMVKKLFIRRTNLNLFCFFLTITITTILTIVYIYRCNITIYSTVGGRLTDIDIY